MLRGVPLLIFPLLAYNLAMLIGEIHATLALELIGFELFSGAFWVFSVRDLFISAGVVLLSIVIFSATYHGTPPLVERTLALLVALVYLIEFFTVASCGTPTFMLLGVMAGICFLVELRVSRTGIEEKGATR